MGYKRRSSVVQEGSASAQKYRKPVEQDAEGQEGEGNNNSTHFILINVKAR